MPGNQPERRQCGERTFPGVQNVLLLRCEFDIARPMDSLKNISERLAPTREFQLIGDLMKYETHTGPNRLEQWAIATSKFQIVKPDIKLTLLSQLQIGKGALASLGACTRDEWAAEHRTGDANVHARTSKLEKQQAACNQRVRSQRSCSVDMENATHFRLRRRSKQAQCR